MRICCMIRSLCLGGAERQLAGLAVQLKQQGHDVEVLTYHEADFYKGQLDEAGVTHCFIPKTGGSRKLAREIAEHFRITKPDAVIAFLVGPSIKACLAKKYFPDFKLAVSERNVNLLAAPHDLFRFLMFRRADAIIPNSHAQEAFIRKHFPFCAPKLHTIVNFVDTEKFCPSTPKEDTEGPLRIVTTARVDSRKNIHGYIKAIRTVRDRGHDVRVEWYGLKKEDRYYRRCSRLIGRLGLEGIFSIKPATSDVLGVYRSADIFCLPSFYEGTPNSLCEAIACGLPAVASLVSDNASYVQDGRNGFTCNPKDPDDIADALCRLIGMTPQQRAEAGMQSREIACEKLSRQVFIGNYSALLDTLFQRRCDQR